MILSISNSFSTMFRMIATNSMRIAVAALLKLLFSSIFPLCAIAQQQIIANQSVNASSKIYDAAKSKLSPDLYPAYRILDRIMSANPAVSVNASIAVRSLDEQTCKQLIGENAICGIAANLPNVSKEDSLLIWALQVIAAQTPDLNAYATSANNRIVTNKALYDALASNLEGKACVIAHELAHLSKDHIKLRKQALDQFNNEAAGKISSAVGNAKRANQSRQFWTAVAIGLNAASAGLNSGAGNYSAASNANFQNQLLSIRTASDQSAGNVMFFQLMQQASSLAPQVASSLGQMEGLPGQLIKRTMVDINSYLGEVNSKISDVSRSHEYDADSTAVEYLANAGINPKGCLDVIKTLHRGSYKPFAAVGDSHPGEEERTANLEKAIQSNAAAYRRAQSQLLKPAALPYRYDERLEIVTIYPRGSKVDQDPASESKSVDRFLAK
ncbi:MAG: M48 family metalloprotease [Cyanobacteriota bacterium]|nr:M48 family metalloprotease [Cyanobacteriota bacterium]